MRKSKKRENKDSVRDFFEKWKSDTLLYLHLHKELLSDECYMSAYKMLKEQRILKNENISDDISFDELYSKCDAELDEIVKKYTSEIDAFCDIAKMFVKLHKEIDLKYKG